MSMSRPRISTVTMMAKKSTKRNDEELVYQIIFTTENGAEIENPDDYWFKIFFGEKNGHPVEYPAFGTVGFKLSGFKNGAYYIPQDDIPQNNPGKTTCKVIYFDLKNPGPISNFNGKNVDATFNFDDTSAQS